MGRAAPERGRKILHMHWSGDARRHALNTEVEVASHQREARG